MSAFVDTPYTALIDKYPPCPQGYEEHWYAEYFEIAVAANQIISQQPLQLDTDQDFRWRAVMGSLDYQFEILFYDPWGNKLATGVDLAENIVAKAQPGLFWPEVVCPRGSTPLVDIVEYTGNSGTLKLALLGVKRFVANG
jgi:hypothetical protein